MNKIIRITLILFYLECNNTRTHLIYSKHKFTLIILTYSRTYNKRNYYLCYKLAHMLLEIIFCEYILYVINCYLIK